MRPALSAILSRLLEIDARVISLDLIGEEIGVEAVTAEEIDEIFSALEASGRSVGAASPNVREHLSRVIRGARQLKSEKQSTPDVAAIARLANLTPGEVRAALLYASVLGREK